MNIDTDALQELADSMHVSVTDLLAFARGISNELKRDNMDQVFLIGDLKQQNAVIQAYAKNEVRKIEKFHTKYLTDPAAKKSFQDTVYESLMPL